MAYSELIKNFQNIRDYIHEFYVYGLKNRDEYTKKSARSYDDERRRIESWLGEYTGFRQTAEGKNVYISFDSRISHYNPLYRAWKTKSFTDGDIILHFYIFDILHDTCKAMSLNEITDEIDKKLLTFNSPKTFDSSTVRKKMKEYVEQGLIYVEKCGKTVLYRRAESTKLACPDALNFFSEVAPCGVIGSFLLDKMEVHDEHFAFKHHYITGTMDSEILYALFGAIHEKKYIMIETVNRHTEAATVLKAVPLKIFSSVQSGRQYLMAYMVKSRRIDPIRLDNILSVCTDEVCCNYDIYRKKLDRRQKYIWGVNSECDAGRLEHVEFVVRYSDGEAFIHERLEREKRCGQVERIDNNSSRYTTEVYDAGELIPWIRSFICRITYICFSDKKMEEKFKKDIDYMYHMYELDGGDKE